MKKHAFRGRLLASTLLATTSVVAPASVGLISVLAPGLASAQDYTSGNLNGRVVDDAGAPVAGASVVVKSGQGVSRTATTDEAGRFTVPALSVGAYTADISKEGMNTLVGQKVSIAPGSSSFSFTLSSGTVSELVVVAATRETQDFGKTDTGQTYNVQEIASRVPVARSIASIALLTPGVSRPDTTINDGARRNQSTLVVAGTSAAESVYYINGLNVTDLRNLLGYSDLPFDAIQSIDVKTGGYQAEFGRATGGVVNIVTRAGSNEFHGGFTLTYTPKSLETHAPEGFATGGSSVPGAVNYYNTASLEQVDSTIWASGPIWKDHLFFFGLYNPRSTKEYKTLTSQGLTGNNLYTGVQTYTKSTSPRWLTKFDLNITDTQRLEATLFSDKTNTDQSFYNRDVRVGITGQGLGYDEKAGGMNQIYKYTGAFTDWFTLSALYGKTKSSQEDTGPLVGTPRVRDRRTSTTFFLTGANAAQVTQPIGEDTRTTYRVDGDFYVSLFGDHHFRVGWDKEKLFSKDLHQYNGGYYLDVSLATAAQGFAPAGTPYGLKTVLGAAGEFKASQTAWYLQDSWDLTPNLTIQAGVRLDQYNYKNRAGESYIKLDDQFAPRLGFTWDPRGEGRDKVYGSYGRYYLPIATNTSIREVSGEKFQQEYYAVSVNPNGTLVTDANGIPVLGAKLRPDAVFALPIAPDPAEIADAKIKPMFEEEFILGYEHEFTGGFADGWKAGARLIHRKLKSTIEDTDLGRGGVLTRYCARTKDTSCTADTNDLFTGAYILLNPGRAAELSLDLANGPGGPNLKQITLSADDFQLPKAKRKYDAVEFSLERPFDGKWTAFASYVLARSKGNYEGAVKSDVGQTDTSITQDFDAFFLAKGAYGYLPNDHRHTIKVYGAYQINDLIRVGVASYAQSGRPYGCLGFDPDDPSAGATPSSWICEINGVSTLVPRGTAGRTEWVTNTDLNVTLDLIRERDGFGSVSAAFDVFNVFNERAVTRVVEQGEVTSIGGPLPTYGLPRSFQSPRTIRGTLRYNF